MTLSSHNQTPLQIGWKKLDGLSLIEFDRLCSDLDFVLSFRDIPQDELGAYFIPSAIEKFLCKEQLRNSGTIDDWKKDFSEFLSGGEEEDEVW